MSAAAHEVPSRNQRSIWSKVKSMFRPVLCIVCRLRFARLALWLWKPSVSCRTWLDGRVMLRCSDVVWRFLPDQWLVMHFWAQSTTQANIIGQQRTEQRRMKTLALRMAFIHYNMWKITVLFNDCTNTEHALSRSRLMHLCMFPVYLKWLLFMVTLEKRSYIFMPLLLSL